MREEPEDRSQELQNGATRFPSSRYNGVLVPDHTYLPRAFWFPGLTA